MDSPERKIWFPGKRYGWGWGLPVAWQGWMVLLFYVGGIVLSSFLLPASGKPLGYGISVFALTFILVVICWVKGERP